MVGAVLYLVFTVVSVAIEWRYYPERGFILFVSETVQVVILIAATLVVRRRRVHPQTAWGVLGGAVALCFVFSVYNAAVGGDLLYALLTYLTIMLVSPLFVPWGGRFQFAFDAGVAAAYCIALAGGARQGPVPGYEYIALVFGTVLSTLGAVYMDRYRRQLFTQTATLREINQQLEEANRARTELLSGLSHDMRLPISVLIGYGDLLDESEALPEDLRSSVRSIRRETRALLALVEGILDLVRLERGRLPIDRSTFYLAEQLGPLRETVDDLVRDRDVAVRWEIPGDLTLDGDAKKVQQIVTNLVSNAVKFTRRGEIRVGACLRDGGVEITVADTGHGIAPERADLIFQPFHCEDQGSARYPTGLGFGLYLVQLLVGALGGRIRFESAAGTGSTFHVWLPDAPEAGGSP